MLTDLQRFTASMVIGDDMDWAVELFLCLLQDERGKLEFGYDWGGEIGDISQMDNGVPELLKHGLIRCKELRKLPSGMMEYEAKLTKKGKEVLKGTYVEKRVVGKS